MALSPPARANKNQESTQKTPPERRAGGRDRSTPYANKMPDTRQIPVA